MAVIHGHPIPFDFYEADNNWDEFPSISVVRGCFVNRAGAQAAFDEI